MSQLQTGLSIKDVGLTVTAASGTLLLFFMCDQAHYCAQKASLISLHVFFVYVVLKKIFR